MQKTRSTLVKTYTDAPEAYDGFGTRTLRVVGDILVGFNTGKPVRLVETPDEHVVWQRSRYMSGNYLACPEERIGEMVGGRCPVIRLNKDNLRAEQ